MNQINEDSNSLSIGFAPLQKILPNRQQKKPYKNLNLKQKIQQLNHKLITSIQIISSKQIQNSQFRKQLKNYRYQRKSKSTNLFNDPTLVQEKQIQQLFFALKDLFSTWRQNLQHKFYISMGNGDLMHFFHKSPVQDSQSKDKKGGSFCILNCKKTSYSGILKEYGIKTEKMKEVSFLNERLLIKNNQIQLFYKQQVNNLTQNSIPFEIVSNFCFLNCCQIYPIENYNGKQKRAQYDYIAEYKQNILGQSKKQLYSMKIQGMWFKQNIERLQIKVQEVLQRKPFQMIFKCHSGCQEIAEEIENL